MKRKRETQIDRTFLHRDPDVDIVEQLIPPPASDFFTHTFSVSPTVSPPPKNFVPYNFCSPTDAADILCHMPQNQSEGVPSAFSAIHSNAVNGAFASGFFASHCQAYVAGASVIANHADAISAGLLKAFTERFESVYGFPHVFAQLYITPPSAAAVAAHADDRDVFVVQLYGTKHWTVYKEIPTVLPFHDEQVGKAALAVPEEVLNGQKLLDDAALEAGAVMYLPRGMVHSARCSANGGGSIHVTIAVPTAHWSLRESMSLYLRMTAKTQGEKGGAGQEKGDSDGMKVALEKARQFGERSMAPKMWRSSMPLAMLRNEEQDVKVEQTYTNTIAELLKASQEDVSLAAPILAKLAHVQRSTIVATNSWRRTERQGYAERMRLRLAESARSRKKLGVGAGKFVNWDSSIRWSTEDEKAMVSAAVEAGRTVEGEPQQQRRGLMAAEAIADAVSQIVSGVKAAGGSTCAVNELSKFVADEKRSSMCDLTLLLLVREIIENGAFTLAR